MKSQRIRREVEAVATAPAGMPRARLDKQPEDIKAIILGERGQRRDNICFFHISVSIEMIG